MKKKPQKSIVKGYLQVKQVTAKQAEFEIFQGFAASGRQRPTLVMKMDPYDLRVTIHRFQQAAGQMITEQEAETAKLKECIGKGGQS